MTPQKIYVGIDNDKIELTGQAKDDYLTQLELNKQAKALLETEYEAKKQARIDAITKLGQASGLTTAEIESILNI